MIAVGPAPELRSQPKGLPHSWPALRETQTHPVAVEILHITDPAATKLLFAIQKAELFFAQAPYHTVGKIRLWTGHMLGLSASSLFSDLRWQ